VLTIREGLFAQSRKDFISKMNIALKEAGETDYWIEILYSADYLTEMEYKSLKNDNDELIRMLSSIVKTTKENTPK
jgi:four helix bundle protein